MNTQWIEVHSSLLAAVAFEAATPDSETGTLRARFKDGAAYRYEGVPRSVYDRLISPDTESVGKLFHSEVRGQYEHHAEGGEDEKEEGGNGQGEPAPEQKPEDDQPPASEPPPASAPVQEPAQATA